MRMRATVAQKELYLNNIFQQLLITTLKLATVDPGKIDMVV
jgi:hypothetical protein